MCILSIIIIINVIILIIFVILFEVPVFRVADVGTVPERKSQHFFNALDFIVSNKHPQGEYRYKTAP